MRDIDHEHGICLDFLQEAVARFAEDEAIPNAFVKAMVEISTRLSKLTMNDNYKPHVNVSSCPWSDYSVSCDIDDCTFRP